MKEEISLCMIAKNEGNNIERCLKSTEKYVDEIIIVDTGSKDNTIQIAKEFNAIVIEESWKNNFSFHRNTSLEAASGDWILFLDCDEELAEGSGEKLHKAVQKTSYEAFFVQVKNIINREGSVFLPSIRLFRNRDCYRFRGKIHEQIVYSITENYGKNCIGDTDIIINHYGYNPSQANIMAKTERNLKILNDYSKEEKDGFFLYNLGSEYLRKGDNKKAFSYFWKSLEITKPTQAYAPYLIKKLITTMIQMQRYRDAIKSIQYYINIYPDYAGLYFQEAISHYNCGRFTEAKKCFKKYLSFDLTKSKYSGGEKFQGQTAEDFLKKVNSKIFEHHSNKISVCIIGKEYQENLFESIKSINELASEIIYLDGSGKNEFCNLAYQMGAKVFEIDCENDISKFYNVGLKKAEGKWVLFIQADEVVPAFSLKKINHLLNDSMSSVYMLKIFTFSNLNLNFFNSNLKGEIRLLKNKQKYKFTGKYSEFLSLSTEGDEIEKVDIPIYHINNIVDNNQSLSELIKKKLELIKYSNLNEKKKDYLLGLKYYKIKKFKKAVIYFNRVYNDDYIMNNCPNIYFYYSMALINQNNYQLALEILKKGIELYNDYTDLSYLKGIIYFKRGDFKKAEKLFERCLEMGEGSWDKFITTYGTGSFKAELSLAMTYINLKQYNKALNKFKKLIKDSITKEQAVAGLTQVFINMKKIDQLEEYLKINNIYDDSILAVVSIILAQYGFFDFSYYYLEQSFKIKEKNNFKGDKSLEAVNYLINSFKNHFNFNQITDLT